MAQLLVLYSIQWRKMTRTLWALVQELGKKKPRREEKSLYINNWYYLYRSLQLKCFHSFRHRQPESCFPTHFHVTGTSLEVMILKSSSPEFSFLGFLFLLNSLWKDTMYIMLSEHITLHVLLCQKSNNHFLWALSDTHKKLHTKDKILSVHIQLPISCPALLFSTRKSFTLAHEKARSPQQ